MKKIADPYLQDILDSVDKIIEYLSATDYNRDSFQKDTEKQDAVIRRLEIIGEASKRLEDQFKNEYPDIPWKKMSGMRDILIHEYDRIDLDLVWKVSVEELPSIRKSIRSVLESIE
jgi:uncharacterized protein with HEPN domain